MSQGQEFVLFAVSETIQAKLDYLELEETLAIRCTQTVYEDDLCIATLAQADQFFPIAVISVTEENIDGVIEQIRCMPVDNRSFNRFILISEELISKDLSNGWDIGMLGYVSVSHGISGLYQLIALYFTHKKEVRQLESQLKEASELAVVAMSASSQLGEIIRFLELASLCPTPADLGALMLTTMDKMGLQASLILRTEEGDVYCGQSDKENYQKRLLQSFVGGDRFIDIDVSTVVNFDTISGLVKNMPGPDSEEQGRIKDSLFRLFEGGEERLKQIQVEQKIHKAERVRHQFLAILAHELRTPMNATLGFFRRLAKIEPGEVVTDRHISAVQIVEEANQRLANVIEDIVDLASVGSVEDIKKTKMIVWEVCFSLISNARQLAESKGLAFDVYMDESLEAEIEPGRVQRILKVLVENAIKYTDQGSVSIKMSTDIQHDGEEMLVFEIADSGRGIAEDKVKAIFEPFSIGDDYLTRDHEGAGLGMAIAAEFTRELGGEITLESTLNKGTLVCVFIPRYEQRPDSDEVGSMDVELF